MKKRIITVFFIVFIVGNIVSLRSFGQILAVTISSTNEHCVKADGTAIANPTGGTAPYTFHWSNGQTSQKITGLAAGPYVVKVKDMLNDSATANVTITNIPSPTASIVNVTACNCGYSNGSITASASGGTPPYTYLWSPSYQVTATAVGLSAGVYTVTVTDTMGCTASASGALAEIPGPLATVTATPDFCSKSLGTATVLASGGYGIYTYYWSDGQTTPTAIGLSQGTYTVEASDGGCTAQASAIIGNIPGPHAAFLANPKAITVMHDTVSFLDQSTGSIVEWDWSMGDGATETGIAFTHTYPFIGKYPVTLIVIDTNGCKSTASDTIIVTKTSSINEVDDDICFNVFPNPNNGVFTIAFSNLYENTISIELTDVIGKVVFSEELNRPGNIFAKSIDISTLTKGIYYLKIYNNNKIKVTKIIKE